MSETYTLTSTHTRPDGQICALFRVTRPDGGYDYRITGPDLKSIYTRMGLEPVELHPELAEGSLPPAPEPVRSVRWTIADIAASKG